MKKLFLTFSLALLLLSAAGCVPTDTTVTPDPTIPEVETPEISEPGAWVPDTQGPWDGATYLATSTDGLTFEGKTLVMEQAGVPNLLLRENGDLVLTYQYFSSTEESMFDTISYSVSQDDGTTWTDPEAIAFEGLPEGLDAKKKPMDPTIVENAEGGLRLYFTYHAKDSQTATLYSALAADGDITAPFVVQPNAALVDDTNLLDPAIVFFKQQWHHYTWSDQGDENIHSVSGDGIMFTREDDVTLPMDFLGQVIQFGEGLRFYGTSRDGVVSAYSADGYSWTMTEGAAIREGADPGVQQLADGTYVMVYTSMNFNQ